MSHAELKELLLDALAVDDDPLRAAWEEYVEETPEEERILRDAEQRRASEVDR